MIEFIDLTEEQKKEAYNNAIENKFTWNKFYKLYKAPDWCFYVT